MAIQFPVECGYGFRFRIVLSGARVSRDSGTTGGSGRRPQRCFDMAVPSRALVTSTGVGLGGGYAETTFGTLGLRADDHRLRRQP